jgi:hypothetical protein
MTGDLLSTTFATMNASPSYSVREWENLLGQATNSLLLARLAQHYVDNDWMSSVPERAGLYLEGALRLADRQIHEVRWEVDCISKALRDTDTPIVILKGAAYLLADLPMARSRLFSDIDVLVSRDQIENTEAELMGSGWISMERDPYNSRYYRQWMHEIPPLTHVRRNTVLDLHHTITPPTSRFKVSGKQLLDKIVPVDLSRRLYVLGPPDMVLHSAVHLFQEGDFLHGLRDLLDMNDLLLHFGQTPVFWEELFARAEELGLGEPLYHALHHTKRLFGMHLPSELSERYKDIAPGGLRKIMLTRLLTEALKPNHPSCDTRLAQVARWLLYVRSHYLRMPLHLVIPHLVRKAFVRHFPAKNKVVEEMNLLG